MGAERSRRGWFAMALLGVVVMAAAALENEAWTTEPAARPGAARLETTADEFRIVVSNPASAPARCRLLLDIQPRRAAARVAPVDVTVVVPERTTDAVVWRAVGDVPAYRIAPDWGLDCGMSG